MLQKMCDMLPKMCTFEPNMGGIVPKVCGVISYVACPKSYVTTKKHYNLFVKFVAQVCVVSVIIRAQPRLVYRLYWVGPVDNRHYTKLVHKFDK